MTQLLVFSLLLFCAMAHAQSQPQNGDHVRATRSVEVTINGPIGEVFSLFTPEGETHWIPTWKYTPIYPASGETVRDMVFRTDEETIWALALYEPPHRSIYVHRSPDVLARIEVECQPIDSNHTHARVTWVLTALTSHGQMIIEQHQSEAEYTNRAKHWKEWLDEYAVKQGWGK